MPAPSQLAIATSSLQRLAKEESSYHKELQMQQKSIERLEKDQTEETEEDRGNHEFQLKQEVRGWMNDFQFLLSCPAFVYFPCLWYTPDSIRSAKLLRKQRQSFLACMTASQVLRKTYKIYWHVFPVIRRVKCVFPDRSIRILMLVRRLRMWQRLGKCSQRSR
jgi:hypothetical protein